MQTPEQSSRPRTLRHAAYGVLATVVGLAAAHLVAALTVPAASPVLAVGSTVIDLTPTPLKEWAIRQFGTADKIILVGSVTLVVLLLAAVAGIVAARLETVGLLVLVGLAGVAGVLAVLRPGSGPLDLVPALVAAVVATASLWWLHRVDGGSPGPSSQGSDGPSRRGVLVASGGLAAAAVAMGGLGRWVTSYRLGGTDVALPVATDPASSFPTGLEERFPGITPLRTPTGEFYRVDTRLTVPAVDVDSWTLTIDGDVDQEVTLTFDDLSAMTTVERDITLTCVSNEVGGPYVGGARWLGVPLADVLARAGIDSTKADQILSTDVDGMTISTPLGVALDGRDAMIAIGMNGGPLPRENGFPARMVVPGLYGFVSACKWITRMTLTTYDAEQAYWTERDWATDAPIKISSRIDTPKPLSDSDAGTVVVGGIAWAQGVGIEKVEVRIDGEAWKPAELGPQVTDDYWRQWYFEWDAEPGQHFIACRATNKDGDVQTDVRMTPFPEGSSGVQEISVNVG
ncbi:DMSO/TMAO reductase YedYZ molybdopterin-dependent catalytic subunit [Nocardioides cavernae]|uniref:DMSO/TMAO reductase YedYZ molybdopterin-dependent catalytic subunit n=1 Tax=Nocardioides cavernae TaxID=1921566 RepID=A0A7Y9H213_9ACTN|nr:molybdopterin-dependent oxidoreductase [Nocardioides cavernae]NYE36517.1 DMSO/TMAO reductase YedYZ molybdopterin-dependent catalytic subunit [Nocardioides cavernae]